MKLGPLARALARGVIESQELKRQIFSQPECLYCGNSPPLKKTMRSVKHESSCLVLKAREVLYASRRKVRRRRCGDCHHKVGSDANVATSSAWSCACPCHRKRGSEPS